MPALARQSAKTNAAAADVRADGSIAALTGDYRGVALPLRAPNGRASGRQRHGRRGGGVWVAAG